MRCKEAPSTTLPISPLVGEMPGRAEGGAKDRCFHSSLDSSPPRKWGEVARRNRGDEGNSN
ncbi:MAG: hypothetical protein EOQ98_10390 [Mesorhizobium sp.]|nr:hypothetical protein EOB36_32805 [Mesorhizobium sp. M6A.T.Cr.TU.017.01.1.1]RWP00303.1 MAG: hypothetical protein EOQ98_10390 [Mesorhizobium sp.]